MHSRDRVVGNEIRAIRVLGDVESARSVNGDGAGGTAQAGNVQVGGRAACFGLAVDRAVSEVIDGAVLIHG